MDLSKYVKITGSTPSAPKMNQSSKGKGMNQQQMMGLGLIVVGVILIGLAIMLW